MGNFQKMGAFRKTAQFRIRPCAMLGPLALTAYPPPDLLPMKNGVA